MVYTLAGSGDDQRAPLETSEILQEVDGDWNNIALINPIDEDGNYRNPRTYGGPKESTHVPTRAKRDANLGIPVYDFVNWHELLISKTAMDIIERFEPGVHQFFPLIIEQGGEVICERYIFQACNHLDSLARDNCLPPVAPGQWYRSARDGENKIVFSKTAICGHHVWRDEYVLGLYISDALRVAFEDAELLGLSGKHYDQV